MGEILPQAFQPGIIRMIGLATSSFEWEITSGTRGLAGCSSEAVRRSHREEMKCHRSLLISSIALISCIAH